MRTDVKMSIEGRVVQALHDLSEFPGFSVSPARGQGRGRGTGGSYRATEYDFTYLRHLQLQIVRRAERSAEICSTIANSAWTGQKGDGVIWTTDVQEFRRIREIGHPREETGQ